MTHNKGIGYDLDSLIEKLRERAMDTDPELAFLLGVASGKLREQETRISQLEAGWIPVTERLPEYGQEVIVYTGNILKPIVMAYTFWKVDYDTWLHVTHWMPMPEGPEG